MTLFQLLVALIVVGMLLWLLERVIPMDATFRKLASAVVIILFVFWLLSAFFGWPVVRGRI